MPAIRILHVLAMALFVGGQLVLVMAVVPGLRGRDREGLRAVARAFGRASIGALLVLLVTGAVLASDRGWWDEPTLHVKLALVLLAGGLVVLHTRRPGAHAIEGAIFVVSLVIVWLGLALAHGPLPF